MCLFQETKNGFSKHSQTSCVCSISTQFISFIAKDLSTSGVAFITQVVNQVARRQGRESKNMLYDRYYKYINNITPIRHTLPPKLVCCRKLLSFTNDNSHKHRKRCTQFFSPLLQLYSFTIDLNCLSVMGHALSQTEKGRSKIPVASGHPTLQKPKHVQVTCFDTPFTSASTAVFEELFS